MILQCSECKARYLVSDQAIGASGRTVRCASCKHSWFQEAAPGFVPQTLPELEAALSEINAKPKPIPKGSNLPVRRQVTPIGLKVSVLTALAASLVIGAFLFKPGLFGFPSSRGMVVADLGMTRIMKDKRNTYEINGNIMNTTEHTMAVPNLRITLVDENGIAVQRPWDFPSGGKTLEAGKNIPFDTDRLDIFSDKGTRFVVELGNPLELALRRKPE